MLQKITSHLKTLGATRITSKVHTVDPKILDGTVQNFVATATRHTGFVHPCYYISIIFTNSRESFRLCQSVFFPTKNFVCISHHSHVCHVPFPSYIYWVITVMTSGEGYRSWSSSLCSCPHCFYSLHFVDSLDDTLRNSNHTVDLHHSCSTANTETSLTYMVLQVSRRDA
jgi:hypothetical protein